MNTAFPIIGVVCILLAYLTAFGSGSLAAKGENSRAVLGVRIALTIILGVFGEWLTR